MKISAKEFKEMLMERIESSRKASYNKKQLMLFIEQNYSKILELHMED